MNFGKIQKISAPKIAEQFSVNRFFSTFKKITTNQYSGEVFSQQSFQIGSWRAKFLKH
jgi:hypothetical protein